jgi:hypothetical protein
VPHSSAVSTYYARRSVPTVEFIGPTISNAAADAGRPKPRIIAVVPALVSDERMPSPLGS